MRLSPPIPPRLLMTVAPKGWGLGVRMRFFVVVHNGEDSSGSLWGANATH